MQPRERICAAIDFPSWAAAEPFARAVAPEVGMLKVGLELFVAEGPPVVRAAAALGLPVFLDLKLHDIPNTVEGAARSAAASGASLLTVHASGGTEMVRAAVRGAGLGVRVLAVTVLTPRLGRARVGGPPRPARGRGGPSREARGQRRRRRHRLLAPRGRRGARRGGARSAARHPRRPSCRRGEGRSGPRRDARRGGARRRGRARHRPPAPRGR